MENDQEEVPTASVGMWIALIIIAGVSFWCQATVTEERFVPALNVVANKFKIPDDIAGATLMAAGASSPELFSSFVALFITHSSLGLGTVFGSEVFNQLIICAGAVYSSRTGDLKLNKAVVTREVFFYALGISTLYLALQDVEPVESDPTGIDHIFINFGDALLVFIGYIFYVIVCANMEAIVRFFTCTRKSSSNNTTAEEKDMLEDEENAKRYGAISDGELMLGEDLPFLMDTSALSQEPVGNFETVEFHRTATGGKSFTAKGHGEDNKEEDPKEGFQHKRSDTMDSVLDGQEATAGGTSFLENSIRGVVSKFPDGNTLRPFQFLMTTERPSDEHGVFDIEENSYQERLSCFMWQRSYFYNKARFATHGWHLRWFSLMHDRMLSIPNRADYQKHRIEYPEFTEIVVDRQRHIIKLINPDSSKRNFYFMAPSGAILDKVLDKMAKMIEFHKEKRNDDALQVTHMADSAISDKQEHEDDEFESLIEFPHGASNLAIIFFFFLFPVRFLIHFTIPDVRTLDSHGNPNSTLGNAAIACTMCLVWLIVGSYAMVASLEALAALMDIPDAVIGYTVSAAGTSLPNYVASAVAARNGFGNMAVSNALGSNTFNIMIGLGLPWVLYTSFGLEFREPYNELRDEGITEGVLILAGVLALLVLLLLQSGFVLYMWHGHLFVVTYIGYLIYVIGSVYWW